MERNFTVVLTRDEDDVFIAEVPELPGCVSHGDTRDSALKNVADAIVLYLEVLTEQAKALPSVELVAIAC